MQCFIILHLLAMRRLCEALNGGALQEACCSSCWEWALLGDGRFSGIVNGIMSRRVSAVKGSGRHGREPVEFMAQQITGAIFLEKIAPVFAYIALISAKNISYSTSFLLSHRT
jgi:hypothetical protein